MLAKHTPPVEETVAALYEAHREEVYRYLLRLGVPPGPARETCQDAFFRLFLALRNGQLIDSPRKWVFTVAHHAGINMKIANKRLDPLDPAVEARAAASGPNPETIFLEKEKFRRLHRAVQSLSAPERHCLLLRGQGLRYREIAEITGAATSTVADSLQHAIARIRKALHD